MGRSAIRLPGALLRCLRNCEWQELWSRARGGRQNASTMNHSCIWTGPRPAGSICKKCSTAWCASTKTWSMRSRGWPQPSPEWRSWTAPWTRRARTRRAVWRRSRWSSRWGRHLHQPAINMRPIFLPYYVSPLYSLSSAPFLCLSFFVSFLLSIFLCFFLFLFLYLFIHLFLTFFLFFLSFFPLVLSVFR